MAKLNKEIKRRADGIGIVPNDPALISLVGVLMLEQKGKRALSRR